MRKPPKNPPRLRIEKILHAFYEVEVRDDDLEPVDVPIPDEGDPLNWEFPGTSATHVEETDHEKWRGIAFDDNYFDLSVILPPMIKAYEEHKDEYEKIILTASVNQDGYSRFPRIVGERDETDEEYNARVTQLRADYQEYLKQREADQKNHKKKQIEKKKKKLEELQRELAELDPNTEN